MREFLFRKPPEVFAVFITLPILLHILLAHFFELEVSIIAVSFLAVESLIMFHVYTLIRDLDPGIVYSENISKKTIPEHDVDDILLSDLQNWHALGKELGIDGIEDRFQELINEYILRQKIKSVEKQDSEDDNDGDILV